MHHTIRIGAAIAIATIAACGDSASSSATPIPTSAFGTVADNEDPSSLGAGSEASSIPTAVFGDPNRDPDVIQHPNPDTAVEGDAPGPDQGCQPGESTPCTCSSGATGLKPCDDDLATCDCDACPGHNALSASGMLITSMGQFLFDSAHIVLTHRSGAPSSGAGCVISASLTLEVGSGEAALCRLTVEAGGALVDGALPLTTMSFEADAGCLGLSPQDQGTYTTTTFSEGRLNLTPGATGSGAAAACWTGSATVTLEALATRADGQQVTISTSTISATGSGLSVGEDGLCPQAEAQVDINDCAKVVPLTALCNPYCQLGCDADAHCVVEGSEFSCLPIGTLSFGDPCTTADSCSYGLSCFALSGQDGARCQAPCVTDNDCPTPALCNTVASIGGGLSLSVCAAAAEACDVLDPAACGEGQSCYLNGNTAQCLPSGTLGAGEICDDGPTNSCAPGLHCLVTCSELCATDAKQPSCGACPGGHHEFSTSLSLGFCIVGGPPTLCDLFTQGDCGVDKGCYPVTGGIACRSAGSLMPGVPCQSGNSCTPGHACVNGSCLQLCDLLAAASAPTSCEVRCPSSMGAILPANWQIGVCLEP